MPVSKFGFGIYSQIEALILKAVVANALNYDAFDVILF